MGNPPQPFGAWVFGLGAERAERFALLAQPGEAMQSLGRAWRALGREHGIEDTIVVGLANGAMAYITPTADFGADGYEYESTLFGPETGDAVTESLDLALRRAVSTLR